MSTTALQALRNCFFFSLSRTKVCQKSILFLNLNSTINFFFFHSSVLFFPSGWKNIDTNLFFLFFLLLLLFTSSGILPSGALDLLSVYQWLTDWRMVKVLFFSFVFLSFKHFCILRPPTSTYFFVGGSPFLLLSFFSLLLYYWEPLRWTHGGKK